MEKLKETYKNIKNIIEKRLNDFKTINNIGDIDKIHKELFFCILTPQSNARICWETVETMYSSGLIYKGSYEDISKALVRVRFRNNKAKYIVGLRENLKNGLKFSETIMSNNISQKEKREWLVKNIKGLGYKEASHFLRNIGIGFNLAILDRHILKNLRRYNIIKEVPKSLTKSKYLALENKMKYFSNKINIPMPHLDLLFWYMEKGEVFK